MRLSHAGLMVLKACLDRPGDRQYGYDLMQATGLASGTLYPLLMRFEQEGWLISEWEAVEPSAEKRPRRRLYRITGSGQRAASQFLGNLGVGVAV